MKKTFAIFVVLCALTATAGMTPLQTVEYVHINAEQQGADFIKTLDAKTWKDYVEGFVKTAEATGYVDYAFVWKSSKKGFFWECAERMTRDEIAPFDERLAALNWETQDYGFREQVLNEGASFPKTLEALIAANPNIGVFRANIAKYAGKHGALDTPAAKAASLNQAVAAFSRQDTIVRARLFFVQAARMKLLARSAGFIIRRDGSNPLQDVFDQVTVCLNAPRQAGLKELVEDYAPGYKWIDVKYPTDMETMVLVGDVLNGKISIDGCKDKLFFTLGTVQYNEFIRAYNGRQ